MLLNTRFGGKSREEGQRPRAGFRPAICTSTASEMGMPQQIDAARFGLEMRLAERQNNKRAPLRAP